VVPRWAENGSSPTMGATKKRPFLVIAEKEKGRLPLSRPKNRSIFLRERQKEKKKKKRGKKRPPRQGVRQKVSVPVNNTSGGGEERKRKKRGRTKKATPGKEGNYLCPAKERKRKGGGGTPSVSAAFSGTKLPSTKKKLQKGKKKEGINRPSLSRKACPLAA